MKLIELISEADALSFAVEANKILENGYEPIGSISVVHVASNQWSFTQPFGKPGMNDEYHQKLNVDPTIEIPEEEE